MFQARGSVKMVMLTIFWYMKEAITIGFLEKGATVNSREDNHQSGKHIDSPAKKMFQARRSVKMVMLTIFWYMKEAITIGFLEKGATVNSLEDSHQSGKHIDTIGFLEKGAAFCLLFSPNSPFILNDPCKYHHYHYYQEGQSLSAIVPLFLCL